MTPVFVESLRRRFFGRDDLVVMDEQSLHVAAWERRGRLYIKGDAAPHMENKSTYSVQSREGLWINVAKGRIASASKKPVMPTTVLLWGEVLMAGAIPKVRMRRKVRIKGRDR